MLWGLLGTAVLVGCHSRDQMEFDPNYATFQAYVQDIEYPEVCEMSCPDPAILASHQPPTAQSYEELEPWHLTLEETIDLALQNSQVIRDLGGLVVSNPMSRSTVYDPALQELSPINGVERALSAFDAQFSTSLFLNQDEQKFNSLLAAIRGDLTNRNEFRAEISKVAATGTRLAIRNLTVYDRNNGQLATPEQPFGQLVPSVYDTLFQAEFRHPLLRGGGVEVNRIAGPNATWGIYDGVLLARINTDITLADFEAGVRDLLRDVEIAYWDLYYAYYNLDAKKEAREFAADRWDIQRVRQDAGRADERDEALARQQYYAAQALVENALSGVGPTGPGLYTAERNLRRLMGLPPTDGRLIRPATRPVVAPIQFSWDESLQQSLVRRVELRRQKWNVRRRELELIAARNLRLPQLDLVAQYGYRGFGDDLLGTGSGVVGIPGSAFQDLMSGDLQQWQVGVQFNVPIGNRIGLLAVRHAELQLAREKALLQEQERYISHDLAEAFVELDRAYVLMKSTYNSRVAAEAELVALEARKEQDRNGLFFLLDAQQRMMDSEIAFYRSIIDYNLALLDLQFQRGTLLDHMQVQLTEGPWSQLAHHSAAKQSRRFREYGAIGHVRQDVPPLSAGAFDQQPDMSGGQ
jgi:outer membrane protein TolC